MLAMLVLWSFLHSSHRTLVRIIDWTQMEPSEILRRNVAVVATFGWLLSTVCRRKVVLAQGRKIHA